MPMQKLLTWHNEKSKTQNNDKGKSYKCDALRNMVPYPQFKKREKHPWKSVNFSKVAGFSL